MADETFKPTWTPPRTWVAGELVTAAHLNEIRNSLTNLHTRLATLEAALRDRDSELPLKLGEGRLDDDTLG